LEKRQRILVGQGSQGLRTTWFGPAESENVRKWRRGSLLIGIKL